MIPSRPPLPKGLKRATLLCLILSFFVSYGAMSETMTYGMRSSDVSSAQSSAAPSGSSPEFEALLRKGVEARLAQWEQVKGSRQIILGLFWVVAFLTMAGAMRLLRSEAFARENAVRALGRGCFMAALIATLDGAQNTAMWMNVAQAMAKMMETQKVPELAQVPASMMTSVFGVVSSLHTLMIAGGFLALWMYFGSNRVQHQLRATSELPH